MGNVGFSGDFHNARTLLTSKDAANASVAKRASCSSTAQDDSIRLVSTTTSTLRGVPMKTSPFTRWYTRCAVLALLLLTATSTSAASLLTNGDFENEPNFVSGNSIAVLSGSELPGWTIEPGHFLTIHNNSVFPTISGLYSANTDGEGQNGVNADFHQD